MSVGVLGFSLPDDSDMSLFVDSSEFDIAPGLKVRVQTINNMLELNYLSNDTGKLMFTPPGIQYMMAKHREFVNNLQNIDIPKGTFFSDGLNLLKEAGKKIHQNYDTVDKFNKANTLTTLDVESGTDVSEIEKLGAWSARNDPKPPNDPLC